MGRIERIALAAIAAGVAMRLAAPAFMDLGYDANAYVATAHGWLRYHEFKLEWGDVLTFAPSPAGHSHHFPPAYPLYLGLFFSAFGFGLAQAKIAAVVMGILAIVVAYATTRDLYGKTVALVVCALVALDPHLVWVTGMGFSENLALVFFTLTMWAILKSLKKEPYVILAGLFAGLAYLTRSSMGSFFVIAGLGGAAWRLHHKGWRGIARPSYALAILVFASIVGLWALRNQVLFGNWQTSPGTAGIPEWIAQHKAWFAGSVALRAPLLLFVFAPFLVVLWPQARASLRKIRDEHTSALWLSVALTFVLGLLFSAAYLSMGILADAARLDNMRYVIIAILPLAWALVREGVEWRRFAALCVVLVVLCGAVFAFPAQALAPQAARALDAHLQEGDIIGVWGAGKYPFYAYLERPEAVRVFAVGFATDGTRPEFIVALAQFDSPGYVSLGEKRMRHALWPLLGEEVVEVLARDDVARERGLTRLEAFRTGW